MAQHRSSTRKCQLPFAFHLIGYLLIQPSHCPADQLLFLLFQGSISGGGSELLQTYKSPNYRRRGIDLSGHSGIPAKGSVGPLFVDEPLQQSHTMSGLHIGIKQIEYPMELFPVITGFEQPGCFLKQQGFQCRVPLQFRFKIRTGYGQIIIGCRRNLIGRR